MQRFRSTDSLRSLRLVCVMQVQGPLGALQGTDFISDWYLPFYSGLPKFPNLSITSQRCDTNRCTAQWIYEQTKRKNVITENNTGLAAKQNEFQTTVFIQHVLAILQEVMYRFIYKLQVILSIPIPDQNPSLSTFNLIFFPQFLSTSLLIPNVKFPKVIY